MGYAAFMPFCVTALSSSARSRRHEMRRQIKKPPCAYPRKQTLVDPVRSKPHKRYCSNFQLLARLSSNLVFATKILVARNQLFNQYIFFEQAQGACARRQSITAHQTTKSSGSVSLRPCSTREAL